METKTNTCSIIFHPRKSNSVDEKLGIYARVTINGKRLEISLKQRIKAEDWNYFFRYVNFSG